ncbi:hypothetical protein CRE_15715 [Caenorhabditis remanei]|uniref:Tyrosine-protein phosphatase domain-containing protein n=1 Tax=Caenorhabditis remanei TaxID=31234 RepID=E3NCA6_CAERE|nr:hypothetical protein CRE_15715 [Caenorhabditis remanei]
MRSKRLLQLILYIGGLFLIRPLMIFQIPMIPTCFQDLERMVRMKRQPDRSMGLFLFSAPTPDKLKELIDKSSSLARISNGIALQSGLMDGSIKIEDAVGELLNLGTVKVSDVVGFEMDFVKQLTGKLKGLSTNLDKSVEELEKAGLAWKKFEEMSRTVGDVTKLTKPNEYFTSLVDYDKKFKVKPFTEASKKVTAILTRLENIESLEIDEKTDETALYSLYKIHFWDIPERFGEAFLALTALKNAPDLFSGITFIMDSSKTFAPFEETVKLIDFRIDNLDVTLRNAAVKIVEQNFKQLEELAPMFSTPHLKILNDVIAARTRREPVKRTLTTGFVNGASDLKQLGNDVWDSWIETMSNSLVSLKRLENGLAPVLDIKRKLITADEALLSISSGESSMFYLASIQKDASTAVKDSSKLADVFDKCDKCEQNGGYFKKTSYVESQTLIQKILSVQKVFLNLKEAVQKIDTTKLKAEMDAFIKFLGFTDIDDLKKSASQIPGVMKKIKTTDNLKKLKELTAGVKSGVDVDFTDKGMTLSVPRKIVEKLGGHSGSFPCELKNITDGILATKDHLMFNGLDKEPAMYTCFHGLKDDLSRLAQMIQLTHKLRNLDSSKVQKVENAASSLGTATNELKSVSSIPDTMKKDAKEITTEINKWPESLKSSGEIGQSVALLSQANDFKTLVSSGDFDKFDAPVQAQIEAIKDGDEQKRIKTLWGNHSEFLNTIKIATQEIETIGANLKLAEIKTFEDYGTVMKKSLEGMKDVKIDVKAKIEALDALIALTITPAELEKIKKTLQHLESLDLAFSSHSSHFQKVPNALKSLYDFLVTFSIEPTQAPPLRSGNAPPTQVLLNSGASQNDTVGTQNEEKKDDYLILSIVLPLLVILISIPIAIYLLYRFKMLCFKPKGYICSVDFMDEDESHLRPISEDLIVIIVSKQVYMNHAEFFVFWMKLLMLVKNEKRNENRPRPYRKLNKLKYYDISILLNPWSTPQTVRIHGNFLRTWRNVFLAMQSPMEQSDIHMDTRSDFYGLIIQDEVEFVVKLGPTPASGSYYCERVGEKMIIDSYEIETVSAQPFPEGPHDVVFRKIKVSLVKDGKKIASRTFSQFQYTTWTEDFLPPNFELCYRLMEVITVSSKPIVVHCTTGTDRTMAFIGLEYVSRHMELHDGLTFEHSFAKLTEKRFNSFCSAQSIGWLQAGCIYFLTINHGLDLYMSQRAHSVFWEMVNDGTGVPQIAHGTRWT